MTNIPEGRHAVFDASGTVEAVTNLVAKDIPHIFPECAEVLVRKLTHMVRHYADENHWSHVALWVTTGMGEDAFDTILTHAAKDKPITINPDMLHGDAHHFTNIGEARAARNSLLATNEVGHDVMVILEGLEGLDRKKSIQLLQTRLRMMDLSFEMLRDDMRHDPHLMQNPEKLALNLRLLDYAYRHIGRMNGLLEYALAHQLKLDGQKFTVDLHESVSQLFRINHLTLGPLLVHNTKGVIRQLSFLPIEFPNLGLTPLPQTEPEANPQPQQNPSHDLLHKLNYDEMNPSPKRY